ncbi:porin [Sagittula salina]|uniref:Porin n=1 Tax=Sagittula salina TaxID=2820268 RepID=A0A940MVN3_9RHOB|nr:porin [Sagittula salina]MBP0483734.1 porin [Sagittula salina]
MKKILFASTALVAFAGAAAAEVKVTGSVEMGVVGGNRYATSATVNSDGVTQFWTSHEITFTMTGEADNGLTFGAKVQLDEAAASGGADDNGADVYVAYGAARLTMGDTDGGLDWAMQEVNLSGGSIDDSETEHPGFSGNGGFDGSEDGQVARFEYAFGDFAVAISAELDDTPNTVTQNAALTICPATVAAGAICAGNADDDNIYGIGFKYSGDLGGTKIGVGLGYQDQNDWGSIIGASVNATLASGFKVAVNYSEFDPEAAGVSNATHSAIGFGYEMNALAIGLNYGKYENFDRMSGTYANNAESDGYGLAVAYDLGGGLAAQFGYGNGTSKVAGVSTDWDSYSLGLAMSF